jgi:hypothetical protein
MTDTHWHVASGLTGYGPDASSTTYGTACTIRELAALLEGDLKDAAESEFQTASAIVYSPDNDPDSVPLENYKEAWLTEKHGEELASIAMNFSPDRLDAPLYKDNAPLWEETIKRLVAEHFGYFGMGTLQIAHNSTLYIMECSEDNCEHLKELEEE